MSDQCLEASELPTALRGLPKPPARLWVRGSLPESPCVGIVGTRKADRGALAFARELARDLARVGIGTVSGGAEGIDAAAHRGALEGEGTTWVVHGTPLERTYPARHHRLFEEILEAGGGWSSEVAPGASVRRFHFLARNRLIAAFADVVVVVQAPQRSGALSTASWAKKLGRALLAVPASPWDPRGGGCNSLLLDGARICAGSGDVARLFGREPVAAAVRPLVALDPEPARVLAELGRAPRPVDEIAAATGLGVVRVRVALVQLAARSLAEQSPAGWRALE